MPRGYARPFGCVIAMEVIKNWFRRHFSDPQVVILAVLLLVGFLVVAWLGEMLAPVLAAMVIAYLLEGVIVKLEQLRIPRLAAVLAVFVVFAFFVGSIVLKLIPLLFQQLGQLVQQIPAMISRGKQGLLYLPERYPELISEAQINQIMDQLTRELTGTGQRVVSFSIASFLGLIEILIYLVLLPLLIFFFMKDKDRILGWLSTFLPEDRTLAQQVWRDVDQQIGNYMRGKFWEILIVWVSSYALFRTFGLEYAMLLSAFVGLSVLVPYIGATIMALPVGLIAVFQWGWSAQVFWVVFAYTILQIIDGNVLAPLLLSGVTHLHPIAVIVAVLVFGGLWGFWGIFFAIPLATLVHAVIKAWPRKGKRYVSP